MEIGRELGRGVRSVVYALGADEVLKVPSLGTPEAWLREELRIADSVARSGAAVPGGRRAVTHGGRIAMASQRVDGPSMGELLRSLPGRAEEFGRELARIQVAVWSCAPSYEMPLQSDRIIAKLMKAALEHGADLLRALDLVDDTGGPLVLCHGDLHPRNVLLAADGPVLVDWFDGSRGLVDADVARTDLVLRDDAVGGAGAMRPETSSVVADAYRDAILASGHCDAAGVERWHLVQSVARLAEGFGIERLPEVRRRLADAVS